VERQDLAQWVIETITMGKTETKSDAKVTPAAKSDPIQKAG
jgi:hypothetical protein